MKNIAFGRAVILTALVYSCFIGHAQTSSRSDDGVSPKLKPILSTDSKKDWHRFISGISVDPAQPEQFFERYREAFDLKNGYGMTLVNHTEENSLGMNHYRFQQTFNGIPIAGAEYILHQRGDQLKGNGTIISGFAKNESPVIPGETALQTALTQVNALRYAWEDNGLEAMVKNQRGSKATLYPQPRLVYYSVSDDPDNPSSYQLAYEMNVFAIEPMSHQQFYISAADGTVLRSVNLIHETNTPATGTTIYNGVQSITTDHTGGNNYVLKETNRAGSGTAISTYDMNTSTDVNMAVNYQNNSTNWQNEQVGVQGHWSAEKTFDYYYLVHGRNSFNGNGAEIKAYLESGVNLNNAFWNGLYMRFGGGDGISSTSWASLDVVAHEFTHGVTDFSANLTSANEPGALNESFSDIFGAAVEFYAEGNDGDWLVSEDVTIDGRGIRSMSNPKSHGHPDTYLGVNWHFTANDNGGVHTNSGVQNHWFYLLTQGGSGTNDNGNNYSVSGIGIDMAAAIAYRNLTLYLTSDSRYRDARQGALEAAEDLYGRTSQAYIQTAQAWYAVGVGFPVYATQDLSLRSILITCGSTQQVSLELVNSSTTATIPAGAAIDVIVKEDNVAKPAEQITLLAELPPGGSVIRMLNQPVFSTDGKIDMEAAISYLEDPEPGNNVASVILLKGNVTIGGTNPDFNNIHLAIAALQEPKNIVCDHLDFKIRNGQYNGEVRIVDLRAVPSGITVTFESESGNPDDVIVRAPTNSATAFGALNIERSTGIRIKNIKAIRHVPASQTFATGIAIRGEAHDLLLEGNKIECTGSAGPNRTNLEFQAFGEPQSNITVRNNFLQLANSGIVLSGSTINNILIENNILNSHRNPIIINGVNITVRKNKISTVSVENGDAGVKANISGELLFEGNDLKISTPGSMNIVGLKIDNASYAKVFSNMINVTSPVSSQGVFVGAAVPVAEFYHNTIRLNFGGSPLIAINFDGSTTASAIWNNILTSTTPGAIGIKLHGQDAIISNGNNFHFPSGFIGQNGTPKYATLQQWRNATGYDANSTTGLPLFVSDTDLHLMPQFGFRSTIVTFLTSDIDGEVRNASFPNQGADEHHLPGDFGITAIRLTGQSSCNRKTVQIDIKNFGSAPYAAGMQIPVSHHVNGINAATETVTLQQNFVVGQTITYTFVQQAVFPSAQKSVLSARINRPDANLLNNESSLNVIAKSQYTVGGANPDFTTVKQAVDFLFINGVRACDLPHITFKIRPGVYAEPVSISELPGTSLSFESETGNRADVVITSSTTSAISLLGAKHLSFKDLTVEYSGTSSSEGAILIKNICEDLTITNCYLRLTSGGPQRYTIKAGPGQAPQLNGLIATGSQFDNGGIWMESNSNANFPFDNINITGSTFLNSHTHAIWLSRTGAVIASDNIISSFNVSSGISITLPMKDVKVERNRIDLTAGVNGISFSNLLPSSSKIYVFNNVVNMISGANAVNGIMVDGKGGYVYHNTVKLANGALIPTGQVTVLNLRNTGAAVKHNILYSTIVNAFGVDWYSATQNQDYNDFHLPHGSIARRDQQNYVTLAAWQSAFGLDLHSKNIEPLFVGPNDLHLATYQPELRGSNAFLFPFVSSDIDGNARAVPPYIGADEYIRPPFVEFIDEDITDVPLFGQTYYLSVYTNSEWSVVTPLPDGITLDEVTADEFAITVSPNLSNAPRDFTISIQTTALPVATASLHLHQAGPPTLTASAGNSTVLLNWTPVAGNVMSYKIYYSPQETTPPHILIATVAAPAVTTFSHTGLNNGNNYLYQVSAVSIDGTESAKSNMASAIPEAPPFIILSLNNIPDVPFSGASYTVAVTSNVDWTTVVPPGVFLNAITEDSFIISVDPNPGNAPRELSVLVQSVSASATLTLTQDGPPPPFIELSPADISDAPVFGASYVITVDSNTDWFVSSISQGVTLNAVTTESFIISVDPNPSSGPRELWVLVQTQTEAATLSIRQEGPPLLSADGYDGMIILNWTPSAGASQYRLYQLVGGIRPRLLTTLPGSQTTFTHTGLTNGLVYSYRISAVDGFNNETALSNVASTIPQSDQLPFPDKEFLSIYPNPAEDKLVLRGQVKTSGSYQAAIVNPYGIMLQKQQIYLNKGEIEYEVANTLSPGIYVLRLADPSGTIVTTIRFEKK